MYFRLLSVFSRVYIISYVICFYIGLRLLGDYPLAFQPYIVIN